MRFILNIILNFFSMKKLPILFLLISLNQFFAQAQDAIIVGDNSLNCLEDPNCINRLHPAITMTSAANPGDTIYFNSRNCDDIDLHPDAPQDPRVGDSQWGDRKSTRLNSSH